MRRYKKNKYIVNIKQSFDNFWDKIECKLSNWIEKIDIFEEEHQRLMEHEGPATPEFIHQLKKELKLMKGLWILTMICIVCLMLCSIFGR